MLKVCLRRMHFAAIGWNVLYMTVECESENHSVVSSSLWPHGLYSPWNSPGKNTGVGRYSIMQGIFPTQGLNAGLPHCRWVLYQLSHQENPIPEWLAYPFSSGSSWPRNWTEVSCIAGVFFTSWATREAHLISKLLKKWYIPSHLLEPFLVFRFLFSNLNHNQRPVSNPAS